MANSDTIFREIRNVNGQDIQIESYYTLGGMSFLTGNAIPRGYILSVRKVTIENGCVSFIISCSPKESTAELLVPCTRKSKKKASEALSMITEDRINSMINSIMS